MLRALQTRKISLPSLRALARPAALAAAMFLMMRAELMMCASPLAAAYMAAALAAGESPGALVLGCIAGLLRLPLADAAILPAAACASALGFELLPGLLRRHRRWNAETRISLSAGISCLIPCMIHANAAPLPSLQALACGLLSAAAAPFLYAMLKECRPRPRFGAAEKTGAALLAGGCIAAAWHIFPPAAEGICSLLILLFPCVAAPAGLALALGGAGMMKTASLALCALAASAPVFIRSRLRAPAACIACMAVYMMAGPEALSPQWMICAAAAYVLLPDFLIHKIESALPDRKSSACSPDEIAREATRETRRRLAALAEAFAAMAEGSIAAVDVPDEQELICEMRSRLCAGCPSYGDCWAGEDNRAVRLLCDLIGEALQLVDAPQGMRILFSDGEIPPDILRVCRRGRMIPDRLGLLLRDFAQRRQSEIKRCADGRILSSQFLQAREILLNLARMDGTHVIKPLQAALNHAGFSDCAAVPHAPDASSIALLCSGRKWTRGEISRAAGALHRATGGKYLPRIENDALCFVRAPRLSADAGASCQSGVAGESCGDSHMIRMIGKDKLMLAISDGMGCGEAAAGESTRALHLLWRFLDAGISRDLALETTNRQMLMCGGEDMFSTIDLCIIDLNSGIAEFIKLAASLSLILRGQEIKLMDGGCLPLGILENVHPLVRRFRLRPGDMLIMGSDGVMEAGNGMDIERCARENSAAGPEQMAETLVRHASIQRGDGRRDDLTCICVRLRTPA